MIIQQAYHVYTSKGQRISGEWPQQVHAYRVARNVTDETGVKCLVYRITAVACTFDHVPQKDEYVWPF